MNYLDNSTAWNKVQGNWKQLVGQIQLQWGRLTNDDIDQINGERQKLTGRIQERYGVTQEEANRQIDSWANHLKF